MTADQLLAIINFEPDVHGRYIGNISVARKHDYIYVVGRATQDAKAEESEATALMPSAHAYMEVSSRATQDAKAEEAQERPEPGS